MSSIISNVCVTVTGPALSRLLFENTKYPGNQVGFLVGSVLNQLTDTISDSEISCERIETSININSVVPISTFYNGVGAIDRELIMKHLNFNGQKDLKSVLVGWYSFNRNSTFHFSMREYIIHRQLSELAQNMGTDPEHFVFCLLSSGANKATHVFKHSFMRFLQRKRSFEVIPMQIHNLGSSQQLQYQVRACPPKSADMQKELMDSVGQKLSGKEYLLEAQKVIQGILNKGALDLHQKDLKLLKLRKEVEDLRKMLAGRKRGEEQKKQNEMTSRFEADIHTSVDERCSHELPRSPDEKKLDSPGTREATSPILQRQNPSRGRGRLSRTAVTDVD